MPLISVVIPLYNKEPYIKRAINSVLSQQVQEFELIIVDDGSTDKSAEVVKSITDKRIKLIHQENAGVSAARNRGIKESQTDLIAFLDADDEWMPNILETILRLRKKYPGAGAYTTAYKIYDDSGKVINPNYNGIPPSPWEGLITNYFLLTSCGQYPVCSSCVVVPRNIFLEVGVFPVGVCLGEDLDMWGRIALKYPIVFSRKIGAIYHREAVNRACNERINIEQYHFVNTANEAIKCGQVAKEVLPDLKEYIAYLQIKTASNNVIKGGNKSALKILLNCETKKLYWKKWIWIFLSLIPAFIFQNIYRIKKATINTINLNLT